MTPAPQSAPETDHSRAGRGPIGPTAVLAGLDDQQRAAVLAPAGPVCVLAGAGTGKTRTITHRIAHRVLAGEMVPNQVLAITFTARAAGEMRGRLRDLSVSSVQARTFHSAALRQLRFFAPRILDGRAMPDLIESKWRVVKEAFTHSGVRQGDNTLIRDVMSEIEWAKANLLGPADYAAMVAKSDREPPLTPSEVCAIYTSYEVLKRQAGRIDFEDLLRTMVGALEDHPDVAAQIRGQYRHFVVDEYQDVNPLQQRLLDAWLGGRDDLCVVGDASQTIYSFTGASADHLLGFTRRYPEAVVARLERDYRSTPQVVRLANQIIAAARGEHAAARLELIGQRSDGPRPQVLRCDDEVAEAEMVAKRCAKLIAGGKPASQIAVLFRTNSQSESYEQALAERGVPYVVRGGERFFERPEVREAMVLLRGAAHAVTPGQPLLEAVTDALSATGFAVDSPPPGGAARERWEALASLRRLVEVAVSSDQLPADASTGLPALNEELSARAATQHAPTVEGVTLASLHAAKGLEWDAVFMVGLSEGMLPISYAQTWAQVEEERRLCYVGVTRAREILTLSWAAARGSGGRAGRRPSRFIPVNLLPAGEGGGGGSSVYEEGASSRMSGSARTAPVTRHRALPTCRLCGTALFDPTQRKLRRCGGCPPPEADAPLLERLRGWRIRAAHERDVLQYLVFTDATMTAIAEDKPSTMDELGAIPGFGAQRLARYGEAVLALVAGADPDLVAVN